MNLLTPRELLFLADENCPECNVSLNYDNQSNEYYCPYCGAKWLYSTYKKCKEAYDADPQDYLKNVDPKYLP